MTDNIKMEDLYEAPTSEATEEETVTTEESAQDPLKEELEKVKTTGRTEKEKAIFSLKKTAERIKELGADPLEVLGLKPEPVDDEDKPVTKKELAEMLNRKQEKSALDLAEEITDETERELVKHYLENRIVPSGDAKLDLQDARRAVNSIKNERIITEVQRKTPPKDHSNSSGADALKTEEFVATPEERQMMGAPFYLSQQDIIAVRAGKKFEFGK